LVFPLVGCSPSLHFFGVCPNPKRQSWHDKPPSTERTFLAIDAPSVVPPPFLTQFASFLPASVLFVNGNQNFPILLQASPFYWRLLSGSTHSIVFDHSHFRESAPPFTPATNPFFPFLFWFFFFFWGNSPGFLRDLS